MKGHLPELRVDGELLYLSGRGEKEAVATVAEAECLRYPATPALHQRQPTSRRYKINVHPTKLVFLCMNGTKYFLELKPSQLNV